MATTIGGAEGRSRAAQLVSIVFFVTIRSLPCVYCCLYLVLQNSSTLCVVVALPRLREREREQANMGGLVTFWSRPQLDVRRFQFRDDSRMTSIHSQASFLFDLLSTLPLSYSRHHLHELLRRTVNMPNLLESLFDIVKGL